MEQLHKILKSLLGETVGFYDQDENYHEGELYADKLYQEWEVNGFVFLAEEIETIGWSNASQLSIIWLR